MVYSSTAPFLKSWDRFPIGAIFSGTNQIDVYDFETPEVRSAKRPPSRTSSNANVFFMNERDTVDRATITSLPDLAFDVDISVRIPVFEIDQAQSLIRSFSELLDGWDGPDSFAAKPHVVDDAIVVLQNWPSRIATPEPSLGCDGNLVLELFDDRGLSMGGVEMIGYHRAIFTAIGGSTVLGSGSFDSQATSEILHALAVLEAALV